MAAVLGIGGVFFRSRDPVALTEWYRRWLGFEIREYGCAEFPPAGMPRHSFTVWAPFNEDTDYFSPSGREFMINLVVDDVAGVLARAEEGGATIVGDIQREPYGDFGWFIDPEGNKIELWFPKEDTGSVRDAD